MPPTQVPTTILRSLVRRSNQGPLLPKRPFSKASLLFPQSIARHYTDSSITPSTPETPCSAPNEHLTISSPQRTFRLPSIPTPKRPSQPSYTIKFTCTPCSQPSTHTITKHGYHHGSVLITCPSCRNRHIISDHLGIFIDRKVTIEDLMKEKGSLVKKGTLGEDGDVEWWDGKVTEEVDHKGQPVVRREENEAERQEREGRGFRAMERGVRQVQQDVDRRMNWKVRGERRREIGAEFKKGLERMEREKREGKVPEPAWEGGFGMGR